MPKSPKGFLMFAVAVLAVIFVAKKVPQISSIIGI